MMNKMKYIILVALGFNGAFCQDATIEEESHFLQAAHKEKTPIVIVIQGEPSQDLKEIKKIVKRDLEFTDQLVVTDHNGHFTVTLQTKDKDSKSIQWALHQHDKHDKKIFAKGKEISEVSDISWVAHLIADGLYKELTGIESPFLSKISYCKKRPQDKEGNCICIADFDGNNETIILPASVVADNTQGSIITYIAPCWSVNTNSPQLLYSEYTPVNLRLMMTDFKNPPTILTDFNGINMLPAFSPNGKEAYVCLSAEGKTNIYKYIIQKSSRGSKRGEYIRMTDNEGINISPAVLKDGSLVFCSDYELKVPHIYMMDKKGKNIKRLSESIAHYKGMATSPAYCVSQHKIAYVQQVKGVFQLMVYDITAETTTQISFDLKDKTNPSWSCCGNYILCAAQDTVSKKLVCYKLLTSTFKTLTLLSGDEQKTSGADRASYSYPTWSGFLDTPLV